MVWYVWMEEETAVYQDLQAEMRLRDLQKL